jgi:WD40 repeat protein
MRHFAARASLPFVIAGVLDRLETMRWLGRACGAVMVLLVCGCGPSDPRVGRLAGGGASGGEGGAGGAAPRANAWDECGSLALDPAPLGGQPLEVLGVAVSPDRRWLVGTTLMTAHGWRIGDKLEQSTHAWIVDTGDEVYVEFSPDGSLVAISGDGRALVDVTSGAKVFLPATTSSVLPGAYMAFFGFSRSGRWVAGSGYDYAVDVFDTATHALVSTLPSGNLDTGAAFSSDDALVATGVPELYRTSDWKRLWPAAITREEANDQGLASLDTVVFTPDDRQLVVSKCTGNLDRNERCSASLFSVADGKLLGGVPLRGSRPSFSPDGSVLIAGGDVWTPRSGDVQHLGDFSAGVFASNGDVFVGTFDGLVKRFCVRR